MKKIFGMFGSSRPEDDTDTSVEDNMGKEISDNTPSTEIVATTTTVETRMEPAVRDPLEDLPEHIENIGLADVDLGEQLPAVATDQKKAVTELGGRHELIAARLGQIGEILQQLNDAHKLVERLAPPLSATFRHHQILAGQNIALQHALDHVNDEVGTLREREVTATARATSLELELRHLNEAFEQAQAVQAQTEEELRTATGEIRVRDANISDLERRAHDLSAELAELRNELVDINARWQEGATVQNTLTQQLREERENYQTLEHEHQSLQGSVQNTVAEIAQLGRQLSESEDKVASLQAHSHQVENSLAETQAEKAQLIEKVNGLELSIAEERRNLAVKAEGMRGRTETLEKLLAQAREELSTQAETLQETQHQGGEMKSTIARLEARSEKAVSDLQQSEDEVRQLTELHTTLSDRVEMLNKVIQSKDEALQRNKEVLESQAERLGVLESKSASLVETYERQLASLAAALEQEKTERALLEGTLETARQEKVRLQRQLIQYRSSLVDESPVEVQLSKVTYPEPTAGLVPKPSVEAPSIVISRPAPAPDAGAAYRPAETVTTTTETTVSTTHTAGQTTPDKIG
jgi:Chromosome segregation ATPases